jgi:hypothetical protein
MLDDADVKPKKMAPANNNYILVHSTLLFIISLKNKYKRNDLPHQRKA